MDEKNCFIQEPKSFIPQVFHYFPSKNKVRSTMAKYKITVNEECIGCNQCVNVCDNFEIKDDGISHPKVAEVEELGCNEAAKDVCPVGAIKIEEI
jgi:ferredoxin